MFPIRDHNPSLSVPYVTRMLVILNIVMFIATSPYGLNRELLWYQLALYPDAVMHGERLGGLVTHMFLHAGILHLAGNLLFLWVFGDNVEDQMGHLGFLAFYFGCGILAAGAQIAMDPSSDIPMVGASGAIAGVMGAYLLFFPRARIDVLAIIIIFIRIFTVAAWVVLGSWFLLQLFLGLTSDAGAGVAYAAHYGGFVAGLLMAVPLFLIRGGPGFWRVNHGKPPHRDRALHQSTVPRVSRRP